MTNIEDTPLGLAHALLGQFVSVTDAQRIMLATWAAGSHIFRDFPAFARLDLSAIEKGCGKTTALEATLALCPESLTTAYSTQSAVKNWIDEFPNATIGLDERDLLFGTMGRSRGASAELISILNSGYAQNGSVLCVRSGRSVNMPVYNAMAHAGIGRAYDTLLDRSLTIVLRKATPVETWISVLHEPAMNRAGYEMASWLSDRDAREVIAAAPRMVEIKGDRDPRHRLKLAPLAAVASLAGILPEWLDAEEELHSGVTAARLPSRGEMLIDSLRDQGFAGQRLTADEIRLAAPATFTFAVGRIGDIEIAGILRSVGIESTTTNGHRGYMISDSV